MALAPVHSGKEQLGQESSRAEPALWAFRCVIALSAPRFPRPQKWAELLP